MILRHLLCILCVVGCGLKLLALDYTSRQQTVHDFKQMGLSFYTSTNVTLLPSGGVKYDDLLHEIAHANQFVHLDYFKFQQDSICSVFFDLLRQKAKEGVEVRVVFDYVGNSYSKLPLRAGYIDSLRLDGVQIFPFDRMKFPWINHLFHRNHHKIAIVDGHVVYSGGMNMADYYFHGVPELGEWRDMHFRAEGSLVAGYEVIFEEMWKRVTGETLDARYMQQCQSQTADGIPTALCDRVPRRSASIMRDVYIQAIDNARSLVQIVNPYVTLTPGIRKALKRALKRGVRLQIMVSTKNDGNLIPDVCGLEMRNLQKRGAEIYYYETGFHHSKVMMVDSTFCTIGTTNLDGRSLRFDYEVNSFFFDERPTQQLQAIFEKDKRERCVLLTDSLWKARFKCKNKLHGRVLKSIQRLL